MYSARTLNGTVLQNDYGTERNGITVPGVNRILVSHIIIERCSLQLIHNFCIYNSPIDLKMAIKTTANSVNKGLHMLTAAHLVLILVAKQYLNFPGVSPVISHSLTSRYEFTK